MKAVYECMGETLANRIDTHVSWQNEEELEAFRPWPYMSKAMYVNVDTTIRPGIDHAKKLGLVQSGLADMIISSDVEYAVSQLFDGSHKGRALGLFRHPVDRLVSKFYYLQTA